MSKHVLDTRLGHGVLSRRAVGVGQASLRHLVRIWEPGIAGARVQARAHMSGGPVRAAASRQDARSWGDEGKPLLPDDRLPSQVEADFTRVYQDEASRLTHYLARRVGCSHEALDLAHEAFSRVLTMQRSRGKMLDRPGAYLQRVASNLLKDRAKTNARRSSHLHVPADTEPLCGPDQHRLLESRDMLRRLERAMLKLKPKTRDIFLAHRIEGLSYAEIAERTGLSVKGVEKQMSKAIAHIDRTLDTF